MVPSWMWNAGLRLQAASLAFLILAIPGLRAETVDLAVGGDATRTRFVISLERAVDFQVFALANPNRVIVDLPDVKLRLPHLAGDQPVGLVKSVRGGLSAPGKMRVVIDVTSAVIVEKAALDKKDPGQPKLVLDIVPVDATRPATRRVAMAPGGMAGLGAAGIAPPEPVVVPAAAPVLVQPPLPRPALRPEQRAARAFKPLIVLDPGHGGHDSGAMRNGTVEKEVVLAFAQILKKQLEATRRYRVLLTRDNDTFIPLHERREFAEKHKAALFIAIHADYASTNASGATIYSLREAVANSLVRSVKGERSEDLLTSTEIAAVRDVSGDTSTVRSILSDLAARETLATRERTGTFVRSVIEYMKESTNLKDNPDRSAAFAVLRTAKVPAVLIELAYVTNSQDAQNLRSEQWRKKVAGSMVTAVENYFSHHSARMPM